MYYVDWRLSLQLKGMVLHFLYCIYGTAWPFMYTTQLSLFTDDLQSKLTDYNHCRYVSSLLHR